MKKLIKSGAEHQLLNPQGLGKETRISYFRSPIRNVKPFCTISLNELAAGIAKDEKLKRITHDYRTTDDEGKKRRFKLQHFDHVTFSGIFTQRSNHSLHTYSGLMVLDLDNLQDVIKTRQALIDQDAIDVVMMYVSPSGNGLKVVVPATTKDEHEQVFYMYQRFLKQEMEITLDASGKDVARTSFVCSDPNVYLNLNYKFKKLEDYWELPISVAVSSMKSTDFMQEVEYLSDIEISAIKDFNKRGNIEALLLKHGWRVYRRQSDKTHYTRPGKSIYGGPSGNVLHSKNSLYVFTSSSCFQPNQSYKASEVYAVLNCNGDMQQTNKELKALGYGYQGEEEEEKKFNIDWLFQSK